VKRNNDPALQSAHPAMTIRLLERDFPADRLPLLRWLMFTGVTAFGFVIAWHYGLFHLMLASDKTYISALITVLYVAISLHCLVRTAVISRELDSAQRVSALVSRGAPGFRVVGSEVVTSDGVRLPPGQVTGHIRNLILKAGLQGSHRLDQTLLLRGLADAIRGPNQLGAFASDALMKLGLLGTIIGFILMLAPIAGLDAADRASVKSSMGLMSDGMAVAMYTTLTGLVGSVLVQTQYYMLDEATAKLFGLATDLTEVFVVSVLERESPASLHPASPEDELRPARVELRRTSPS
jgi:MotA/TolQ/ExbB proton channel family